MKAGDELVVTLIGGSKTREIVDVVAVDGEFLTIGFRGIRDDGRKGEWAMRPHQERGHYDGGDLIAFEWGGARIERVDPATG